ncbi:conserved hypothetical protein [Ricinus communis]|uniref:Uncharacterized protein n=1 Tax=Ricinus communis TaxID=3988 RepID=B9S278_RICCO|nr:conserved hypothetical protein [Ricinus communis]
MYLKECLADTRTPVGLPLNFMGHESRSYLPSCYSEFLGIDIHMFHFGSFEVCLLWEEFAAILDTSAQSTTASLAQYCGGPGLDLPSLMGLLKCADLTTLTKYTVWHFYLIAQFLLVREDGLGDLRIVSLLPQLAGSTTLAPVILVETLVGLDRVKVVRVTDFKVV